MTTIQAPKLNGQLALNTRHALRRRLRVPRCRGPASRWGGVAEAASAAEEHSSALQLAAVLNLAAEMFAVGADAAMVDACSPIRVTVATITVAVLTTHPI